MKKNRKKILLRKQKRKKKIQQNINSNIPNDSNIVNYGKNGDRKQLCKLFQK